MKKVRSLPQPIRLFQSCFHLQEEHMQQDSEVDQWKQLMQRMLVLLSRDGFASSAADSGKVNELQTPDSAAAR